HPALGGQDEFFPLATKPTANDFFTLPRGFGRGRDRINIGGVNEGDAAVRGLVENGGGGALIALVAEGHCAQADFRDLQSGPSHAAVVHEVPRGGKESSGSESDTAGRLRLRRRQPITAKVVPQATPNSNGAQSRRKVIAPASRKKPKPSA